MKFSRTILIVSLSILTAISSWAQESDRETCYEKKNRQVKRLEKSLKNLSSPLSFIVGVSGKKKERLQHLVKYGIYWNTGDIDGIVSSFSDEGFVYKDLVVPQGIAKKEELKSYLQVVFKNFPCQIWTLDSQVFETFHGSPERMGVFYKFELYEDSSDITPAFTGTGMENYVYSLQDGNMREDSIHLLFDQMDLDKIFSLRKEL